MKRETSPTTHIGTLRTVEDELVQAVEKHPELGAWAATVVRCLVTKSVTSFAQQITPTQENIVRELARKHGVTLPR